MTSSRSRPRPLRPPRSPSSPLHRPSSTALLIATMAALFGARDASASSPREERFVYGLASPTVSTPSTPPPTGPRLTLARGSRYGLTVGALANVFPIEKAALGPQLARATVIAVTPDDATLELPATVPPPTVPLCVEVSVPLPRSPWPPPLFELLLFATDLTDNAQVSITTLDAALTAPDASGNDRALHAMHEAILEVVPRARQTTLATPAPTPGAGARLSGLPLAAAMAQTTLLDLTRFLRYAADFGGAYACRSMRVSEAYATWLVNGEPPAHIDRAQALLALPPTALPEAAKHLDDETFGALLEHHLSSGAPTDAASTRRLHALFASLARHRLAPRAKLAPATAARLHALEARAHELAPQNPLLSARHHAQAARLHREAGELNRALIAHGSAVQRFIDAGRFDEALREIETARSQITEARRSLPSPEHANLELRELYLARLASVIDERRGHLASIVERLAPLAGRYLELAPGGARAAEIELLLLLAKAQSRLGRPEADSTWARIDALAADLAAPIRRADVAWERGELASRAGRHTEARAHYEASAEHARQADAKGHLARALASSGQALFALGDTAAAIERHEAAIALRESIGHTSGLAWGLVEQGKILVQLGDFKRARAVFTRALGLQRELSDSGAVASTLLELGLLAVAEKRFADALAAFEETASVASKSGLELELGFALLNVAIARHALEGPERALTDQRRALAHFTRVGERAGIRMITHFIGDTLRELGDPSARATLLSLVDATMDDPPAHNARVSLAEMDLEAGLLADAAPAIARLAERAERSGVLNRRLDALDLQRRLAHQEGRFAEARAFAERQLELARQSGSRPRLGAALRQQALALMSLGRQSEARPLLDEALAIAVELEDLVDQAWIHYNLSSHHRALGQTLEGARHMDEALRLIERSGSTSGAASLLFNRALHLKDMNELERALADIERAMALAMPKGPPRKAPVAPIRADFEVALISGRGVILRELGRLPEAERELRRALALATARVPTRVVGLHRALGELHLARRQDAEALALLREAVSLEERHHGGRAFGALGELGIALARIAQRPPPHRPPDPSAMRAEAVTTLDTAITRARQREGVIGWWELLYERARLAAADGDTRTALALFKEAVLDVERADLVLSDEAAKTRYYADKTDLYRALIKLLLSTGQVEDAFTYMERAKLAEVQRIDRKAGLADPAVALATELDVQEGRLQALLDEQLAKSPLDEPTVARLDQVLGDIRSRRAALLESLDRKDAAFDRYAVRPLQLEKLRENLGADVAVLAPMLLGDELVVFIVTRAALTHVTQPLSMAALDAEVTALARDLDPRQARGAAGLASLRRAKARAQALFDLLVRPAISAVGMPKTLVISPMGSLRYIPWAALHDGERHLVERTSLVVATALDREKFARASPRGRPDSTVLLLADPDGSLPFSRTEAQAIREVLATTDILDGSAARLSTLRQKLRVPGYDILHLATHGRLDQGTPELSHIVLADARLDYKELPALNPTRTELIILSACQTAVMAGGDGAEIYGLAYQLLRGPTHSVMASLWEVSDAATAELFSRFYRSLSEGRTFHESLALAQRAMLGDPALAHPALWAPFFLMGAP